MANLLWDNLGQNAGIWIGSFTRLTPDGTIVDDTPSRLTLERTSETSARFQVCRYPAGQPPIEHTTEFASINRSSLFCTDGSFTKGSMQWSPVSEFGAELALTQPEARLRLVQVFKSGGALDYLVLIRETREGTTPVVRPMLTVDQLVGTWQGKAINYSPSWIISDPIAIETTWDRTSDGSIRWRSQSGANCSEWQGQDTASSTQTHQRLLGDQGGLTYQLLCLPNGGSSFCPQTIQPRTAFFCEVGWLLTPTSRLRLQRQYQADGSWLQHTWIHEVKVS
ncbi:MAG: DUF3598 family protein [Cyanobacteria bacterium P01_H01_bin.121]